MKLLQTLHISLKYQIITCVNITINLIRKIHGVTLTVVLVKISKILIFTWNWVLSLATNTVSSLSCSDSLCSFSWKWLPNIQVWITIVCMSVVFQRSCTMERAVSSAHNSKLTKVLFLKTNVVLQNTTKSASYIFPVLSHRILRFGIQ